MKIKVIWEPEDIKVGTWYYRCAGEFNPESIGYYRSVAHMIGYDGAGGDDKFVWISLSDGLVGGKYTKEAYAEMLTSGNYIPLPNDILIKLIGG